MKTLFIVYTYLGGHGGGVYAERTNVNLFAALSEKMTLVYPYKDGEELRGVNTDGLELIPVTDGRSKASKLMGLLAGKVHRYQLDESFFDKNRFDVVVFDNSVVSSRLIKRFKKAGIKTITIHHNYQIQYLLGDGPLLTLLPILFWTWIYEGQAVRNSDLNMTLTQQDVKLLRQHYSKKSKMEVLGVFEYGPSETIVLPTRKRGHNYVMTGGLGSKQTEESLLKWIDKYYPVLKGVDAEARLTIAGSNPSTKLKRVIRRVGIELIPSPLDMKPILLDADFYLNPVDCGGGLKLRNLDGLKYGLPVLTHKVSLRGYEKMESQGVLFSFDSPSTFVNGIKQLLAIKQNRIDIQKIYYQQYNFGNGIKRLSQILKDNNII